MMEQEVKVGGEASLPSIRSTPLVLLDRVCEDSVRIPIIAFLKTWNQGAGVHLIQLAWLEC